MNAPIQGAVSNGPNCTMNRVAAANSEHKSQRWRLVTRTLVLGLVWRTTGPFQCNRSSKHAATVRPIAVPKRRTGCS